MFRCLLLLIFLFAAYTSVAQSDSSSAKHNSDSLIKLTVVGNSKYKSVVYTTANNTVLSRQDIRSRLLSYQPSAEEYRKFKTARTMSAVFAGSGSSLCIAGLIANQHHDLNTTRVCAYSAVGFLVSEIISLSIESHHFKKSLELYNKQFL